MNYKYDLYVDVNESQPTKWVFDFFKNSEIRSEFILNNTWAIIHQNLKEMKYLKGKRIQFIKESAFFISVFQDGYCNKELFGMNDTASNVSKKFKNHL